MLDLLKERIPLFRIVPELVAEDAKTAWCVSEPASDLMRGLALKEEGSERFVLPMDGFFGFGEEARLRRVS